MHCHVRVYAPKKCSDCAEEAEWIDKTVARKTDVRMQLITTAVFAVGKNPRIRINEDTNPRHRTIHFHRYLRSSLIRYFRILFTYPFIYPSIFSSSKNRRLRLLYSFVRVARRFLERERKRLQRFIRKN